MKKYNIILLLFIFICSKTINTMKLQLQSQNFSTENSNNNCKDKVQSIANNIITKISEAKLVNYISKTKFKTSFQNSMENDFANYKAFYLNSRKTFEKFKDINYLNSLYFELNCKSTFTENNLLARFYSKLFSDEFILKDSFTPQGIILDKTENISGWKIFNVLLSGKNENNNSKDVKKIVKICLFNEENIFLGIATNFNYKCIDIINELNKTDILKPDHKLLTELELLRNEVLKSKLNQGMTTNFSIDTHSDESKLILNRLKSKIEEENKNSYNSTLIQSSNNFNSTKTSSFIETKEISKIIDYYPENNTILNNFTSFSNSNKTIEITNNKVDLGEKLSYNELLSIKSVLFFAQKNNILNKIVEKKGNITLIELNDINSKKNIEFSKNQKNDNLVESMFNSLTSELTKVRQSISKIENYIVQNVERKNITSKNNSNNLRNNKILSLVNQKSDSNINDKLKNKIFDNLNLNHNKTIYYKNESEVLLDQQIYTKNVTLIEPTSSFSSFLMTEDENVNLKLLNNQNIQNNNFKEVDEENALMVYKVLDNK